MRYKCTCPYCRQSCESANYTKAMCAIPHADDCRYLKGYLPTKMTTEIIP